MIFVEWVGWYDLYSIVTAARGTVELLAVMGSEPAKWRQLSDAIIKLVNTFAHLSPEAFQKPIPLHIFFNSSNDAALFFKSVANVDDELANNLTLSSISPQYVVQAIAEVRFLIQ